MAHRKFASRSLELDEMFNRVADTRRESLILRTVAAALRADAYDLKVTSARLTSRSEQLRRSSASSKRTQECGVDLASS
jgi:hypothetical protein